jgi:hypothetical protein
MPEPISQTNASGSKTTRCDVLMIGGGPGRSLRAWRLRAANIRSETDQLTVT